MSVARRRAIAPVRDAPAESSALELQRYANVGRALAAMSDELLRSIGLAQSDVAFLCDALPAGEETGPNAQSSMARAAANVASLLSLARPRQPRVAEVSLGEVVEAALLDLGACLHGLSIDKDLQPDAHALADRGSLLQSLVSLLLDAGDAARARGRIRIEARREGDECVLRVEDDGPSPLQPESLPERANTPLGICRNVLRSFGADLSAGIGSLGGRQITVRLRAA